MTKKVWNLKKKIILNYIIVLYYIVYALNSWSLQKYVVPSTQELKDMTSHRDISCFHKLICHGHDKTNSLLTFNEQ